MAGVLELSDQNFKTIIITMLKALIKVDKKEKYMGNVRREKKF